MGNSQILSRESGRMTPVETEAGTLETSYLAVRAWGEGSNKDHSPWSQRAELKESLGESFFPLSLTHWIRWEKGLLSLYLEKAQFLIRFSHRKGYVSKKDYTSFLVDKESENIKSSNEIENAFEALAEGKAYITKEDMKQVRVQLCPFSLWSHHNLDFAHLEHGCLLQATTIPAKPSFFFAQIWLYTRYHLLRSPIRVVLTKLNNLQAISSDYQGQSQTYNSVFKAIF